MMGSDTPLVDILSAHLPSDIAPNLHSHPHSRPALETLLAFALGADCPSRLTDARNDWSRTQPAALKALHDALGPTAQKHARDSHDSDDPTPKRQKTIDHDDPDDPPRFTLPSISTTSPVRRKVDITVHARSIRFVNPTTRALEASIPLTSITRAFLLPTRGKAKGHWTVVLLSTDVPEKAKSSAAAATQQIIFGLDALSAASFDTTSYAPGPAPAPLSTTTFAKGTETASALRTFLAHVSVPLLEPSTTVFRSACASTPTAGIDAYLGAKLGTLWFMDGGVLWGESKPCAFWAVGDLVPKDGVRLMSATGRTCSVILTRKRASDGEGMDDGEEADETAFSMVDGKEQDPINTWVRHRKHLFGKRPAVGGAAAVTTGGGGGEEARRTTHLGSGTVKGPAWDDSDPDDDDFEVSSEDLEHSSTDEDEGGGGVESGDENEEDVEGSGEEREEDEVLDPTHHPLLRPGAMPRMSKAAIDAVVDMVQRDFVDDASDEVDELEE